MLSSTAIQMIINVISAMWWLCAMNLTGEQFGFSNLQVFQGPPPSIDLNQSTSVVRYGLTPDGLNLTASGLVEIYNQIYNTSAGPKGGATAQNYTSPFLHTTVLDNLRPGTRYFYQVCNSSAHANIQTC